MNVFNILKALQSTLLALGLVAAAHAEDGGSEDAGGGSSERSSEGAGGYTSDNDSVSKERDTSDKRILDQEKTNGRRSSTPGLEERTNLKDYDQGPDGALDAVVSERSLPLEVIVTALHNLSDGQIVNARLLSVNGALQYELTVLEVTIQVQRYFFDALTGQLIKVR